MDILHPKVSFFVSVPVMDTSTHCADPSLVICVMFSNSSHDANISSLYFSSIYGQSRRSIVLEKSIISSSVSPVKMYMLLLLWNIVRTHSFTL